MVAIECSSSQNCVEVSTRESKFTSEDKKKMIKIIGEDKFKELMEIKEKMDKRSRKPVNENYAVTGASKTSVTSGVDGDGDGDRDRM